MNNTPKSFRTTLIFHSPKTKIFESLTQHINLWWSEQFEGNAQYPGQKFTVRFGSNIYKNIEVIERTEQKIVWHVIDAYLDFPDLSDKQEWIDTYIVWKIAEVEGIALVELTHEGLHREMECYGLCVSGWHSFLYSFEKFITTGIGAPFQLEEVP